MELRNVTMGFAVAMLLAFAAAPAHAAASVVCIEKTANTVDRHGTDGSECFAGSDGSGKAKASATGDHSFADSELQTGGKTTATATGGSFSEAVADTGGHAISNASSSSSVTASSDEHGVAKGTATGSSEADASAFGKCNASAKAAGAGSLAVVRCEHDGTFARAKATGGGIAKGFDDAPPICTPNGGFAKVRSSGGNCGP